MHWIVEPGFFSSPPVHVALVIGAVVAVVSAVVGVFTVMRSQSFAGHTLTDVSTAGGAGAVLVGISPLFGFVGSGLVGAGAMDVIGVQRARGRDLATGIVLGAATGLAALFLYLDTTDPGHHRRHPADPVRLDLHHRQRRSSPSSWCSGPCRWRSSWPSTGPCCSARSAPTSPSPVVSPCARSGLLFMARAGGLGGPVRLGRRVHPLHRPAHRPGRHRPAHGGPGRGGPWWWPVPSASAATWLGILLAYDSFYWDASHQGLARQLLHRGRRVRCSTWSRAAVGVGPPGGARLDAAGSAPTRHRDAAPDGVCCSRASWPTPGRPAPSWPWSPVWSGFFVVLRGSAFPAHAIPNGAFAGAAGASLLGINALVGLGVFSVLAALGIGSLGRRGRHDVVTALALVMMLALGAAFLSQSTEYEPQIYSLLFGEILGVEQHRAPAGGVPSASAASRRCSPSTGRSLLSSVGPRDRPRPRGTQPPHGDGIPVRPGGCHHHDGAGRGCPAHLQPDDRPSGRRPLLHRPARGRPGPVRGHALVTVWASIASVLRRRTGRWASSSVPSALCPTRSAGPSSPGSGGGPSPRREGGGQGAVLGPWEGARPGRHDLHAHVVGPRGV